MLNPRIFLQTFHQMISFNFREDFLNNTFFLLCFAFIVLLQSIESTLIST